MVNLLLCIPNVGLAQGALVPGEPTGLPAEVAMTWDGTLSILALTLENRGDIPLSVDWTASAFIGLSGTAERVLPGSARRNQLGQAIPPSVVPPHARIEERLFRADHLNLETAIEDERFFLEGELEALREGNTSTFDVRLALELTIDGTAVHVDQPFTLLPSLAECDPHRDLDPDESLRSILLSPGVVCVTGSSGGSDCWVATGLDKAVAFARITREVAGCADAREVRSLLEGWKAWRTIGNFTLIPVAFWLAGQEARSAEQRFSACVAGNPTPSREAADDAEARDPKLTPPAQTP